MRKLLTLTVVTLLAPSAAAQPVTDGLAERIRMRIEAAGSPPLIAIGNEIIYSAIVLPELYEQRAFEPLWLNARGSTDAADALIRALRAAPAEGLRSQDYHLDRIVQLTRAMRRRTQAGARPAAAEWVDLDLLLTDAFLIYGAHLVAGRVDPLTIQSGWHAARREVNLARVLTDAITAGRIEESLRGLLPRHRGYSTLRDALTRYRGIAAAGGWRPIREGPTLRPGDIDARVPLLRARVFFAGDLADTMAVLEPSRYDSTLAVAVRRYQRRHGLEPDGVVGPSTMAELNTTVGQRIRQMEVNLERWRWLPQHLGDRYILVNIAGFWLDVMESEREVLSMRAVVGRPYRMTPVFSDRMTYLVLSPTWTIPRQIAVEDKLPLIRRNPGYLSAQRIRVLRQADMREVDPSTVNWSRLTASNFPYVLRQEPGPLNALGRVKFMFPNRFNVYLHDTPSREHFPMAERAFSSGCIRLEKPLELAAYLLNDDPRWTRERIMAAMNVSTERMVHLRRPLPVHLLYWTAWAEPDGTVHFRRDIYERDGRVAAALRSEPPDAAHPPPIVPTDRHLN